MELNTRQQEAVEHGEGALLVLAGAGSGKTRVLVQRIARLIEHERVAPYEILAVTFTNKAARELVDRCERAIGPPARDVWAGTFHGIGARLLRRHAEQLGYPAAFTIFDADDQLRLLKTLLDEENIDESVLPPEAVRAFIERQKNEARLPEAAEHHAGPGGVLDSKLVELYDTYQRRLMRLGAMDFGDLIVNVVRLFRDEPELLARYQQRFRHVLVDEYQDTNHAQYLIVSMLAARHGNICVVGDDDQSIYGWRGADLRNILEFERAFPGATTVHLDQNYRSTGNIIEAAHAVIANNGARMDKRMWTANDDGPPVRIYKACDERDEARYIIDHLKALGRERGEAAVFYRTNAQSRAIEEGLVEAAIPYVVVGATRFYERREVKDLIAYLRFLHNPDDDVSLARIINVPARGIGRVTWDRLRTTAAAADMPVWRCVSGRAGDAGLGAGARARVEHFAAMVTGWLEHVDADADEVTPMLTRLIEDSGYVAFLENLPGDDGHARVENVQELVTVAQNFDAVFDRRELEEEDAELGVLSAFLEQLTLASAVDGYENRGGTVTLMTAHNSKGLEFGHVFLAGMEEGIFPHSRATSENPDGGIEEERRLCYVGMTRAQKQLTLLHAQRRHLFGQAQFNFPSRFLDELPPERVEREHAEARTASSFYDPHVPTIEAEAIDDGPGRAAGRYRVGMKVVHPMFGVGTVRKCDASGDDEKLVVQFQRAGLKKLVARFARLEIV